MVHDQLSRLGLYLPKAQQEAIANFLVTVRKDMPEGKSNIKEDKVYARIMSYPTKLPKDCTIEAHDEYVDIQFTLAGCEGIDIFPRAELSALTSDVKKDFYTFAADKIPHLSVANTPGWFTMLFPHEAHRPQESLDGKCAVVKKGVIKIKMECFRC